MPDSHPHSIAELFANNREWAARRIEDDPKFFAALAALQAPRYLWIGCADSRVPANEIVGLAPGELFVHRNVANVVVHTDLNCLSVIQFAVDVLKVEHVIVTGHYRCGGVRAALHHDRLGLIDNWLRHIEDVEAMHHAEIEALPDEESRWDRLCELNVVEQVINTGRTTIVQEAWERGQPLALHGCIYGLADGYLRDLGVTVANREELDQLRSAPTTAR